MTDPLFLFKERCREAFRFLIEQHGFAEQKEAKQHNPYSVLFSREGLKVSVKGEGYGSVGSVSYVTNSGIEVPYQCLDPDWQPFLGKSGKRRRKALKRQPEKSQEEQIFDAAKIISIRDHDILAGDYARLDVASRKIQSINNRFKTS